MKITELTEGQKNKQRVNVYTEEGFLCALYLDTIVRYQIGVGKEFSPEELCAAQREDERQFAFETALQYLSYKMRSKNEVAAKLKSKKISQEGICYALQKLTDLHYLDDREYAKLYAQELSARFGKLVIEQKLYQKGIDRQTVQEVTAGLEQRDAALQCAQKLAYKYRGEELQKRRQKIFRSMLAKGFGFEEIKQAVAQTEEQMHDEEC